MNKTWLIMKKFEKRPLLIYDGECEFCIKWARKFKAMTGKFITFIPLQYLPVDYEYVTRAACLKSVQYIDGNNRVSKGAEAVFQLFHTAKKGSFLFTCYRRIPIFRVFTEFIYSWVARNRHLFS